MNPPIVLVLASWAEARVAEDVARQGAVPVLAPSRGVPFARWGAGVRALVERCDAVFIDDAPRGLAEYAQAQGKPVIRGLEVLRKWVEVRAALEAPSPC